MITCVRVHRQISFPDRVRWQIALQRRENRVVIGGAAAVNVHIRAKIVRGRIIRGEGPWNWRYMHSQPILVSFSDHHSLVVMPNWFRLHIYCWTNEI